MGKEILYCIKCNKIFRKTDYDQVPRFIFDKQLNDFVPVPQNDLDMFLKRHEGHSFQEMSIVKNSSYSQMPYRDMRKATYFEATDGRSVFLIKKGRNKINDPLNYRVVKNGWMKVKNVKVSPQADLIREQMKKEFPWIGSKEMAKFISIVKKVVGKMNLRDIEECFWDTGDPLTSLGKLNRKEIRIILNECQKSFEWNQLKKIRDFIEENNCNNGAMTVRLEKKLLIVKERRMPREKGVPKVLSLARKAFSFLAVF